MSYRLEKTASILKISSIQRGKKINKFNNSNSILTKLLAVLAEKRIINH